MSGSIKGFACLLVFALLIYAAIRFGGPWFRYYLFKSDVSDMVRFPARSADVLKAEIMEKAKEDHVPLSPDNLTVAGRPWRYRAAATWQESADIFGRYRREFTFTFDENAEAP
ncbi:MAG: hypothetical protein M0Z58_02850 [Nitrospiraceae bacterium]|nr:hypothetical protein [Nitrospiraceae bacterium]